MNKKLEAALKELATDSRISCQEARKLAEELGIDYSAIGAACDELKIKVHSCQLGCF